MHSVTDSMSIQTQVVESAQIDPLVILTMMGVVILVLGLFYRSSESQKSFYWRLFAALFVAVGVFWLGSSRVLRNSTPATPVESAAPQFSTEEMWNRLTEARIQLDDETANDAKSETAKPARPAWVDAGSTRVGGDVTEVVRSEPFTTVDECYAQLEHQFLVEAWRRMKAVVPENQKELLAQTPVTELGIPLDYIMREICQEEYTKTIDSSVGEMKQVYVLMKFTPQIDAHLLDIWQSQVRQSSLGFVAKIAALVLAILAALYGLLQLDTMTRGYYTRRLLVGASAAIIAVAAALYFG